MVGSAHRAKGHVADYGSHRRQLQQVEAARRGQSNMCVVVGCCCVLLLLCVVVCCCCVLCVVVVIVIVIVVVVVSVCACCCCFGVCMLLLFRFVHVAVSEFAPLCHADCRTRIAVTFRRLQEFLRNGGKAGNLVFDGSQLWSVAEGGSSSSSSSSVSNGAVAKPARGAGDELNHPRYQSDPRTRLPKAFFHCSKRRVCKFWKPSNPMHCNWQAKCKLRNDCARCFRLCEREFVIDM